MYLIDTCVISELRKGKKANSGVRRFIEVVGKEGTPIYVSVITVGELRRGVEMLRHRGDHKQSSQLEAWLEGIIQHYAQFTLDFTLEEAQVWGRLRVPNYENSIDKQIAATALTHGLTLVTRNVGDFNHTGVPLLNPFVS